MRHEFKVQSCVLMKLCGLQSSSQMVKCQLKYSSLLNYSTNTNVPHFDGEEKINVNGT